MVERVIKLTQILGTGMAPVAEIWVNPDHIMAVQPRNPKDGYGQPQTGSIIHMVTTWTFHVVETPDDVTDKMVGIE